MSRADWVGNSCYYFTCYIYMHILTCCVQFEVLPRCRERRQVGSTNRWRLPESLYSDLLGNAQALKAINMPYNSSMLRIITGMRPPPPPPRSVFPSWSTDEPPQAPPPDPKDLGYTELMSQAACIYCKEKQEKLAKKVSTWSSRA